MHIQNPKPRSRAELESMLDTRLAGNDVLKLSPNQAMRGFNANLEAHKLNEAENIIRDQKIREWLGENHGSD